MKIKVKKSRLTLSSPFEDAISASYKTQSGEIIEFTVPVVHPGDAIEDIKLAVMGLLNGMETEDL